VKVNSNEIVVNDITLRLPQNEFLLLLTFMQHENKLLAEGYLYERVWGQSMGEDNNAVQRAISRLRKSLKSTGYEIEKMRNKGYIFTKG
jgi:DNA-binding response OmpR family regulator